MRIIQFAAQRFKQPIEKFHVCGIVSDGKSEHGAEGL